ncbi:MULTISPECIES: tetratricopeptide repeat protein [Bacillus]|uniref:tetratricopeptide repeat protein n=1 Tax=Bacillus amyloliquefaciens group TaxID=1938374 RepID=UPI0039E1AE72
MSSVEKEIPSPYVANLLNTWNEFIAAGKIQESIDMKSEIERLLSERKDEMELVEYFYLLDYSHSIAFGKGAIGSLANVVSMLSKGNHELLTTYYYDLCTGDYEYFNKNYTKAIAYYESAERTLSRIPDVGDLKFAEFHYKIGIAYYAIDQHLFSVSHVAKAKEIFEKEEMHKNDAIQCSMIMGVNLYDMGRLDEAEIAFRGALTESEYHGYAMVTAKIYHNLGLIQWQRASYDKAIYFFEKAYSYDWIRDSEKGLQTVYMLSRVNYNAGHREKAFNWYQLGLEQCDEYNDDEYRAKLKILFYLYEEPSVEKVKHFLAHLEEHNLWPDVSKIAMGVADLYEERGDLKESHVFLKKALYAKDQILKITEALP